MSTTEVTTGVSRPWHLLDASDVAVKELGAALNRIVPLVGWQPEFHWFPPFHNRVSPEQVTDPPLQIFRFGLQRGYSRGPLGWLSRFARRTSATLENVSRGTPLICTTPFYAPVAQRWQGPVIYYLTDLAVAYDNLDPRQVTSLDRDLCRVATLVCPNSRRLAEYLIGPAGCDPGKITILPNAARSTSIREGSSRTGIEIPDEFEGLPRPVIGVIGNLAGNLDWRLLEQTIRQTPAMTWMFVGPVSMGIRCKGQRAARDRVLEMQPKVRFVGFKPYGQLHRYARAFDAAVMPYRRVEPTFSGSSTRFYEHLAACRPMFATRGVDELTRKSPLLRLIDGPEHLAQELTELARNDFHDGFEDDRWRASHAETWDCRAQALVRALKGDKPNFPASAPIPPGAKSQSPIFTATLTTT